jgi:hypothetical protein
LAKFRWGTENSPDKEAVRFGNWLQEVLSLFEHLTRMGDGTIRHLEIKHGLPFLIRIEERAA